MIFVTVGTHEQQFNRLIEKVDRLVGKGIIKEKVVIQTGFSTYEPKHCEWKKIYQYNDMKKYVEEARIVITHGGPSSFIMPLQIGKTPIVVPRKQKYGEHVNDHQVDFCRQVERRMGTIYVVEDINKLSETILRYDDIASGINKEMGSNNKMFCEKFGEIVDGLLNE